LPMEGDPQPVRFWRDVPSAILALGPVRNHAEDLAEVAEVLRREEGHRVELDLSRQRHRQGAKRGDLTGPNPTDRAKSGTKRHVLADRRGVPLGLTLSGANVPDMRMAMPTIDWAAADAPGPQRRRPENCCLDKGYDYKVVDDGLRRRGIVGHTRRRGEPPLVGWYKGVPRRWVIERTNSWHNRFRGLLIRWERKAENYLALLQLASGIIAFRTALR
jgi:transposase